MSNPLSVLQNNLGLREFLPGQETVIRHLLDGHSAAAIFPTGGGKSLCYQLPALMLPNLTLVVSPLLALMKDQCDRLTKQGIAAARLDSTLSAEASSSVMKSIRQKALRLLYIAPERFANERFRESLKGVPISLFAVDEAHCISEWGHNFRPEYLKLARFAREFQAERILALTATATPAVLSDICIRLGIEETRAVRLESYRPNLSIGVSVVRDADRIDLLIRRLSVTPPEPSIVYVTQQKTAESVAERLAAAGRACRAYHAGMTDELREEIQDWFLSSNQGVVVATIAFGMGIDKANIRNIYHFNLPKSLENFSQEIGRSGRDGKSATCEAFVCLDDLNVLENFAYGDTPSRDSVEGLVKELFGSTQDLDVSLYDLSYRYDIRPVVLKTVLTYLELDDYLDEGTPYYAEYTFKPRANSQQILSRFEGERQSFLRKVLAQSRKAQSWFHLDLDKAAQVCNSSRDRVVRALDYLAELNLMEVRVSGLRNRYYKRKQPKSATELAKILYDRLLDRECREIRRIGEFLTLVGSNSCFADRLANHFGERLDQPCGKCSWCQGSKRAVKIPQRPQGSIPGTLWRDLQPILGRNRDALRDARAIARFLCGIPSPRATRAKLSSSPLFGSLAHIAFTDVMKFLESRPDSQRR